MPQPLSEHTRVRPGGDGRYTAQVTDAGGILGGLVNGGFLLEMAARALADTLGAPHPVTITGHFLRAVRPGPVELRTEPLRAGRHRTGRATMHDGDGEAVLAVTGTFTDLSAATGDTRRFAEPPPLPDPDSCFAWPRGPSDPDRTPNVMARFRHRLDSASFGWSRGQPSGEPLVQAWARPEVGTWDPLDVLTLVDVYPPTLFGTGIDFSWVPTLELTVQLRSLPSDDEWLACRFETRELTGGYLEEDGEVRTADGRLVAMSRQLALAPKA